MGMSLSKLWDMVKDREAWNPAVHGVTELDTFEWVNNTLDISVKFLAVDMQFFKHRDSC